MPDPIVPPPNPEHGITDLIVAVDRARHLNRCAPDWPDPVLNTLTHLADWRGYTHQRIRAVLAYARTVQPRPYKLADLADAVGMSISGVRIAFGEGDIRAVTEALHRHTT